MTYPHMTELPKVGSRESLVLDFKGDLKKRKRDGKVDKYYIAARVASMANAVGGTLLFGAIANGEALAKYDALEPSVADDVEREADRAVKERCQPAPLFRFERFGYGNGARVIVAMHIEPLYSIVATRTTKDDADTRDGWSGDAWTFWVRVGTQSKDTTPEVIAMTKPETRRIANLLRQAKADQDLVDLVAPPHAPVPGSFTLLTPGIAQLWQLSSTGAPPTVTDGARIEDIDETTNAVSFSFHVSSRLVGGGQDKRTVALDGIRADGTR